MTFDKTMQNFKRFLCLAIGLLLCTNTLYLLSLNKLHLGTVLPAIIGIGLMVYALIQKNILYWSNQSKWRKYIYRFIWSGFFLWLLSLVLFFAYIQFSPVSRPTQTPIRAIIVLGSGLDKDKPSETLQSRLDRAAELAKQHPQAIMIMTGGLGFNTQVTEAEVMASYLHVHYPMLKNKIELEDQSTSTALNLKNTQTILKQAHIDLNQPIAIVTSDFHSLRAHAIAQHQGYQNIISVRASTPLNIRYNSWLREYFAYLSGFVLAEF